MVLLKLWREEIKMRKQILILLFTLCLLGGVQAQKSAKDYFNQSSALFLDNKKDSALRLVSHGIEVYESDSSLIKLKSLIEGKKDQNQKKQDNKQNQDKQDQQNKDNSDNSQGKQGDKDKQNQSNQGNSQQNKSGDENQQNQSGQKPEQKNGQDKNNQNKSGEQSKAAEGQKKDAQSEQRKKGQISSTEAEMILKTIENDEKNVQLRVQQQKNQRIQSQRIEKNW